MVNGRKRHVVNRRPSSRIGHPLYLDRHIPDEQKAPRSITGQEFRLGASTLDPVGDTTEWRLFLNFFCPSVKLLEKKRVASKIVKRYDKLKAPYQRVLESSNVSDETKRKLKEQYKILNPFELRKALEVKLKKIFKP